MSLSDLFQCHWKCLTYIFFDLLIVSFTEPEGCFETLDDLAGTFASPNFPLPYPPLRDCVWYIEGKRVLKQLVQLMHQYLRHRSKGISVINTIKYWVPGFQNHLYTQENPLLSQKFIV